MVKKLLMALLLAVILTPIDSYSYSMLVEGDPGVLSEGRAQWNAGLWVFVEDPPAPGIVLSEELSISGRFMIVSDYSAPTHAISVEYILGGGLSGWSEPTGPLSSHTQYAGIGLGTGLGTSDLLLAERTELDYTPILENDNINLFTNTWYYVWALTQAEIVDQMGDFLQHASLSIYYGEEIAPTPIPGAVWLLGSGLVGLVGIRRKMKD